jgi:hypothetical protein
MMKTWRIVTDSGALGGRKRYRIDRKIPAETSRDAIVKALKEHKCPDEFTGQEVRAFDEKGKLVSTETVDTRFTDYIFARYKCTFDTNSLETKVIKTGVFGITVELGKPNKEGVCGGTITSDLHDENDHDEYKAALDAIESLILAHACAGIDIKSPAYLEGVEVALAAVDHALT